MPDAKLAIKHRKRRKNSLASFFREIYRQEPDKLYTKSNEEVINRWIAAHPNHTGKDLKRAKQNLANLKSTLRKKRDLAGGMGRGGSSMSHRNAKTSLDVLEESIDECLAMAKHIDREGLGDIIRLLRRARNDVVLKNG